MKLLFPRFAASVIFVMTAAGLANAVQTIPDSLLDDYIVRRWGTEEGVPEAVVMCVAEAPDGFLWVATPNRIACFDGVRFVTPGRDELPPQLPYLLRGIHFDKQGCFWVYGSRGVWRYDGRKWQELSGVLRGPVLKMIDYPGGVAVLTPNGIDRIAGDLIRPCVLPGKCTINDVASAPDGVLWAIADSAVFCFQGESFVREETSLSSNLYSVVSVLASGDVLVKGVKGFVIRHNGAWGQWAGNDFLRDRRIHGNTFLAHDDGSVWVAGSAVCRWRDDYGKELGRRDGFVTSTVNQIFKDRTGNIWMATKGGLYQFRRRNVVVVHNTTGLGSDDFLAVMARTNAVIMCGVAGGGVLEGPLTDLRSRDLSDFPSHAVVSALLTGRDGKLWIGTQGDYLWFTGAESGAPATRMSQSGESINALLEDHQGIVYMGTGL